MPTKKKPFISKKNASTYHVVRRSQRDIGGYYDDTTGEPLEVPSQFVLVPTPETKRKNDLRRQQDDGAEVSEDITATNTEEASSSSNPLERAKLQLKSAGLVDDYDYERHLKPITGGGIYLSGDTGRVDHTSTAHKRDARSLPTLESDVKELDRDVQLDSIALTADCMDDDVAQALFGDFGEGDFEEILDDFCFTAAQEPDETFEDERYGGNEDTEEFDFEAHVAKLIEQAKMEENGGGKVVPQNHEWWQKQEQMFARAKPLHLRGIDEKDEEEFYSDEDSLDREFNGRGDADGDDDLISTSMIAPGVVPKLGAEEEKALCDKFEQTLAEYDSDDVGDLDEECEEIRGERPLEGDAQLEAAFDEFLEEKRDEIFIEGTRHLPENKRTGGSSYTALVGRKMVPVGALAAADPAGDDKDGAQEEEEPKIEEVLAEADEFLANPEVDLPPEEVLIDGKSYFTESKRNPWDCESILSTYSNLDNNPAIVGRTGNRRRKKKRDKNNQIGPEGISEEEEPVQILLSNKTGLPLGVLPTISKDGGNDGRYNEEDTFLSINRGEARKKGETKEEKRLRKLAVKQERQVNRIQKKMMKEVFQDEFSKHASNTVGDDVAGKSVFRFS